MMMSSITNSGVTKKEASHNFKIGSGRWSRLFKKQTAKKGHGLNGQKILPVVRIGSRSMEGRC